MHAAPGRPSRSVNRIAAAVAAAVVVIALVVAGVVWLGGGDDDQSAAPSTTTEPAASSTSSSTTPDTTAPEPTPQTSQIATAKGSSLTVLAQPPAGVQGPSTTLAPSGGRAPIPRVGLNSAAVSKVPEGYRYDNPTYFGNPLVFRVLEDQGEWLRVLVAARPNHTEGWVRASDVELSSTSLRMVLSLADRHLVVYDGDAVVEETDVVIGTDATRTPVGEFFLNEKIPQSNAGGAYGPWILSTNGYSESLDLFDNGLPVIAFHGTNRPELIGSQASNGCIRMPNAVVTRLAALLPAGTPIEIRAGSLADDGSAASGTTVPDAA